MGASEIDPSSLALAVQGVRNLSLGGLTVTHPHKENIISLLDQIDSVASEIGAVNTVVNNEGELFGYNTDWLGFINPLTELTTIASTKVAIIGAGGAARAAAYALSKRGAKVTVFNRTLEKAKLLQKAFGVEALPWSALPEIRSADIIINATTLGMQSSQEQSPILADYLHSEQIFFETIYAPLKTAAVQIAESKGLRIISGDLMFLHQAVAQFELHTGVTAPQEIMINTIKEALSDHGVH